MCAQVIPCRDTQVVGDHTFAFEILAIREHYFGRRNLHSERHDSVCAQLFCPKTCLHYSTTCFVAYHHRPLKTLEMASKHFGSTRTLAVHQDDHGDRVGSSRWL